MQHSWFWVLTSDMGRNLAVGEQVNFIIGLGSWTKPWFSLQWLTRLHTARQRRAVCGGLNEKCPAQTWALENLVLSWWHCLGRFRRCGFARESVSLLVSFASWNPWANSSWVSLLPGWSSRYKLSASCLLLPYLRPPATLFFSIWTVISLEPQAQINPPLHL